MDNKENKNKWGGGDEASTSKSWPWNNQLQNKNEDAETRRQRDMDEPSRFIWMARPKEKKRKRKKTKKAKTDPTYESLTHSEKLLQMAGVIDKVIRDADEFCYVNLDKLDEVHDGLLNLAEEYKEYQCQQEELISVLRSKKCILEAQKAIKHEAHESIAAERTYQKVYTEEVMKGVEAKVVRILEAKPSKSQLAQLKEVLMDCVVPPRIRSLMWEYETKMISESLARFNINI